jgi:hypothetical protein
MGKVQRPINPSDFTAIPRTRELIKNLPEEIRICSEHGEEVTINESEPIPNPGDGAPFAKAAYTGCCDAVIDKVIGGVMKAAGKR